MEYKIDKGIKIPPPHNAKYADLMEAMRGMEVGDSIVIRPAIRTSVSNLGLRLGYKFSVRTMEGGIVRAFRIK